MAAKLIETPAHDNIAIVLQRQRMNSGIFGAADAWIKSEVETSVRLEPRQTDAGLTGDELEISADQNPAVGLEGVTKNQPIRIHIESLVAGAVGIQAAEVGTGLAGQRTEIPTDQNLAVRLHTKGIHGGVTRAGGVGPKGVIQRAIGVKPAQIRARLPAEDREVSAGQDFSVWLGAQRPDSAIILNGP